MEKAIHTQKLKPTHYTSFRENPLDYFDLRESLPRSFKKSQREVYTGYNNAYINNLLICASFYTSLCRTEDN
jgi:hypothetical protein